jgi:hypothetical protein
MLGVNHGRRFKTGAAETRKPVLVHPAAAFLLSA